MVTCLIVTGAPLADRLTLAAVVRRKTSAALLVAEYAAQNVLATMSAAVANFLWILA
jgi:hypothetical protein